MKKTPLPLDVWTVQVGSLVECVNDIDPTGEKYFWITVGDRLRIARIAEKATQCADHQPIPCKGVYVETLDGRLIDLEFCPTRFTRISEEKKVLFPEIALREAHAKPKHPKLDCCGWCGDPLVAVYTPARGTRNECAVHGHEVPVVNAGGANPKQLHVNWTRFTKQANAAIARAFGLAPISGPTQP